MLLMGPILLSYLFNALLIFLVIVLILRKRVFCRPVVLTLFFAAYFLDNFLITLTNYFPILQIIPNHVWDGFLICGWSGKLYSIIAVTILTLLCQPVLTTGDAGFTIRQRPGSLLPTLFVLLALVIWALITGLHSPRGELDIEVLLYMALMPGINEELVYRGYMLGILNKLMPQKINFLGASMGCGVLVTSLLFGLLHGIWVDINLSINIDLIGLRNAILSGFIFAWLRERTGSLLAPVIAHGLEDVLFFLPRMI